MSRAQGQLMRSLEALTIGVQKGHEERRRALVDTTTGEYEQQVHLELSGEAAPTWAFTDQTVHWEMPFLYAPLQRRVPFPTPHFTPGIELIAGAGELIVINASVLGWTITDSQWYVGASVRFACQAPNAADLTPFSAIAHLSFSGYATMAETSEFA